MTFSLEYFTFQNQQFAIAGAAFELSFPEMFSDYGRRSIRSNQQANQSRTTTNSCSRHRTVNKHVKQIRIWTMLRPLPWKLSPEWIRNTILGTAQDTVANSLCLSCRCS